MLESVPEAGAGLFDMPTFSTFSAVVCECAICCGHERHPGLNYKRPGHQRGRACARTRVAIINPIRWSMDGGLALGVALVLYNRFLCARGRLRRSPLTAWNLK